MLSIENFDDEDCWLTPSRDAETQSDKFDVNAYLADVKLSENAGILSKKIARAQQKRASKAAKKQKSLDTVKEVDHERNSTENKDHNMGAGPSTTALQSQIYTPLMKVTTDRASSTLISPSSASEKREHFIEFSPIINATSEENTDEEFEDASEQFPDEVIQKISRSGSFSTIEALIGDSAGDLTGQSLMRAPMSKSLIKVEEEEIEMERRAGVSFDISPKYSRSSSVSPRPLINDLTPVTSRVPSKASADSQRFTRNGLERRSLGSTTLIRPTRSQTRQSGLAPPSNGRQSRTMRIARQAVKEQKVSPIPINLNLHADLATLDDLARKQEELLRQEVMQQQSERKSSWQSEREVSSSHSSAASLASSKSVDIASIEKKLPPQNTSRLRAPSKLPRPTGHYSTANRVPPSASRFSAVEKSGSSLDDCF